MEKGGIARYKLEGTLFTLFLFLNSCVLAPALMKGGSDESYDSSYYDDFSYDYDSGYDSDSSADSGSSSSDSGSSSSDSDRSSHTKWTAFEVSTSELKNLFSIAYNGSDIVVAGVSLGSWIVIGLTPEGSAWGKLYSASDDLALAGIYATRDGGYILGGTVWSGDIGLGDIALMKIDSSGRVEWKLAVGGDHTDYVKGIRLTSDDHILVTGYSQSSDGTYADAFVMKVSPDGRVLWTVFFDGGDTDVGTAVIETSDGDIIVAGYTESFKQIDDFSPFDAWVAKLDGSGNPIWFKVFGGPGSDKPADILEVSDGYLVVGDTTSFSDYSDVFVTKIDGRGNVLWTEVIGERDYDDYVGDGDPDNADKIAFGVGQDILLFLTLHSTDTLNVTAVLLDSNGNVKGASVVSTWDESRSAVRIPDGFAVMTISDMIYFVGDDLESLDPSCAFTKVNITHSVEIFEERGETFLEVSGSFSDVYLDISVSEIYPQLYGICTL